MFKLISKLFRKQSQPPPLEDTNEPELIEVSPEPDQLSVPERLLSFHAARTDGLGQRLKTMATARLFAKRYDGNFTFSWKLRVGEHAIHHAIEPVEETFSKEYIDKFYSESPPDGKIIKFGDLTKILAKSALTEKVSIIDPNVVLENKSTKSLLQEGTPGAFKEALYSIGFSKKATDAIKHAERLRDVGSSVAIHMRAGDVIYGNFRFTDRWITKIVPYRLATILANESKKKGKMVFLFGQDENIGKAIAESTGAMWVPDLYKNLDYSVLQKALFEVTLMSKCAEIISGTSAFSEIAALAAEIPRTLPARYLENEGAQRVLTEQIDDKIEDAASDMQKAFSFSSTAFWMLRDPNPDFDRVTDYIKHAISLEETNGYYWLLLAIMHFRARDIGAAEDAISHIKPGKAPGQLSFVISRLHSDYSKYLKPLADTGSPWPSLILAFNPNLPIPERQAYARTAKGKLPLTKDLVVALEAI